MQVELSSSRLTTGNGNPNHVRIGEHDGCEFFWFKDADEILLMWKTLQQNSQCTPFQRYAWVRALVKSGDNSQNLTRDVSENQLFVVGFIKGKPVMIFPFARRKGMLGDQIIWLGEKISDYNGVIVDNRFAAKASAALLDRVLDMLHKALPAIHAVHLIRNPDQSFVSVQKGDNSSNKLTAEYHSHALTLEKDWNRLKKTIRSSSSIRRLRGKLRALKRSGSVRFGRVRGLGARLEAAQQILNWKSAQLIQNGSRNPFGTGTNATPVRRAIENNISSEESSLEIFGIFQNGNLIAGMLVFVTGGRFYYYVSAYSAQVDRKYSVGTLLLLKVLEVASRAGMKQFDFLIGDEAYKRDWCDTKIPLLHITRAFTFRGKVICALISLRLKLKKFVMRYPKFVGLAKRYGKYYGDYMRKGIFGKKPVISSVSAEEAPDEKVDWGKTEKRA
ncbi:MAG: GNAT family N-acetyltransferase [Rhizobiaceae bacterium]|nr:GNAT family N-acetyltransferase [Rhizobiaceae bacterium]